MDVARSVEDSSKQQGLVWLNCPHPVTSVGLQRILETEIRTHVGSEPPREPASVVILGVGGVEGLLEGMKRIRRQCPTAILIVFGLHLDLAIAKAALRSGARGYIHAGMQPEQITRAISVATRGEIVAPRRLLEYLITNEDVVELNILSARQREILKLVKDGLSNAQIAKRLFVTESTVKQHLRSAYKALGVSNRLEAANLVRDEGD